MYSWGQGRRNFDNFFIRLFYTRSGALGHESTENISTPKRIRALKDTKIVDLTSGSLFAHAIDEEGKLYSWGNGEFGTLGLDSTSSVVKPAVNSIMEQYMTEKPNLQLENVISSRHSSMARTVDGSLYCWGSNDQEQMGLPDYMGFTLSETVKLPMPTNMESFEGRPIMHDISECISGVICDSGSVYWCGLKMTGSHSKINYDMEEHGKPICIGVIRKSLAFATEKGYIHFTGNFFNRVSQQFLSDEDTLTTFSKEPFFEDGICVASDRKSVV